MTTNIYPAVERKFRLVEIISFLSQFDSSDDENRNTLANSPEAKEVLDWGRKFHLNQRRGLIDGKYWVLSEYHRKLNIKT